MGKKKCIENIFLIWFMSALFLIGPFWNPLIFFTMIFFDILITAVCIIVTVKYANEKFAAYLCDGCVCVHIGVIFNLLSYKLLLLNNKNIIPIAVIFTIILLACVLLTVIIMMKKLSKRRTGGFVLTTASAGGAFGILFAKAFSKDLSQNMALLICVFIFLVLSIAFVCVGCIGLMMSRRSR